MKITNVLALCCGLLMLTACSGIAKETETGNKERLAILRPVSLISESVENRSENVCSAEESVKRVVQKLIDELNWPIAIENYEKVLGVQNAVMGDPGREQKAPRFRQYKEIAQKLGVRYVANCSIRELTGFNAGSGFSKRITGRANIDIIVYDVSKDAFVWQENVIDTSTKRRGWKKAIAPRIDQTFFNALKKALEPFAVEGKRKEIARPATGIVVTVKQITNNGKTILLDSSGSIDMRIGDEFLSLGGSGHIKITDILQNAVIAEAIEGIPAVGDIYKSVD